MVKKKIKQGEGGRAPARARKGRGVDIEEEMRGAVAKEISRVVDVTAGVPVTVEQEVSPALIQAAERAVVLTWEAVDHAKTMIQIIKERRKQTLKALDPQCDAAYESWQIALKQRKKYAEILDRAEELYKDKIGAFTLAEEQKRKEKEAAALEEAEKATAALKAGLEKKAEKAEAKGNHDMADMLRDTAEAAFVAPVLEDKKRSEGMSTTIDWEISVVDARKLVKAMADGTCAVDPAAVINWKLGGFKSYVNLTKKANIPGLKIVPKHRVSVKGGM